MRYPILAVMGLAFAAVPAAAIVIRDDRSDAAYRVSADEFPTVAHVLGQTEGTLIAPQWVLTAAHTLENLDPFSRWRVILDGRDYAVSKIIMHPRRVSGSVDSDFDLALLKLEQPAHATPSPLYRWTDEPDQVALLVGRGGTKTGQRGGGDYVRDRQMRRATNKVQAVFAHSLVFTFDDGRNGTDLEGVAGPNDSGGPAFLVKDGVRYLAGVASFASNNAEPGTYGTLDAYTRVSSHRDWIAGVIAQDPPSTVPKWSDEHRMTAAGDWPATALGSLAGNFLKAYAAGPKPFAGYVGEYGPRSDGSEEATLREWAARAAEWGDLVPYSYRTLGERDIAFIAYATRSNEWRGFWLTADSADAARFTSIATGGLSRPDGAPPRLPAPN